LANATAQEHSPEPLAAIKGQPEPLTPSHRSPLLSTPIPERCGAAFLSLSLQKAKERAEALCEAPRRCPPSPSFPRTPFPPNTRPHASANPCEPFPCTELAGGVAVEPFQGAPSPEETTEPLQKSTSSGLEPPLNVSPTSCYPAAALQTLAGAPPSAASPVAETGGTSRCPGPP
jgi:hypothetical protein